MIEDTLARLQARLENISSLGEDKKQELFSLFSQLKEDVADLSETQSDRIESITRFTELSTHEAPGRRRTMRFMSCPSRA
jgi:hypothetical protein